MSDLPSDNYPRPQPATDSGPADTPLTELYNHASHTGAVEDPAYPVTEQDPHTTTYPVDIEKDAGIDYRSLSAAAIEAAGHAAIGDSGSEPAEQRDRVPFDDGVGDATPESDDVTMPPPIEPPPTAPSEAGDEDPGRRAYEQFEANAVPPTVENVNTMRYDVVRKILPGLGKDLHSPPIFDAFAVVEGRVLDPFNPETDLAIKTTADKQLNNFTDTYSRVEGAITAAAALRSYSEQYTGQSVAAVVDMKHITAGEATYAGQYEIKSTEAGIVVTVAFSEDWMVDTPLVKHEVSEGRTQLINPDGKERYDVVVLGASEGEPLEAAVAHEKILAPNESDTRYFKGLTDALQQHRALLIRVASESGVELRPLTDPDFGSQYDAEALHFIDRGVAAWNDQPSLSSGLRAELARSITDINLYLQHHVRRGGREDTPEIEGLVTHGGKLSNYLTHLIDQQFRNR